MKIKSSSHSSFLPAAIFMIALIAVIGTLAFAQPWQPEGDPDDPVAYAMNDGTLDSAHVPDGYVYDVPFGIGERFRYHMDFSFVRAGLSEMAVHGIEMVNGRPAYMFTSRVRSTSGIDLVYKVRDEVRAWFDVGGLYSHRYERDINEGSYHSRKYFDYDHETGWVSISNENGPKGVTQFEPFSHNVISALYWVRAQDLVKDTEMTIPLHDLDTQYPLTVKVYGKEEVTVPAGTWECWKVEPIIKSEGLFQKAGRLWVYISADENRIPVKMSSKISVGTIDGNLVDYKLGYPYEAGAPPRDRGVDDDWDW